MPALTFADALRRGADGTVNETLASAIVSPELAYVLFTSGSTGQPRGVELTHHAAMNTAEFLTRHFAIGATDRCLALSPLECDMSVLNFLPGWLEMLLEVGTGRPSSLRVVPTGIARGYRGRPDLTADRFVLRDGRIWYRTGDLARYWPDGTLEFVGRTDDRVKISGYRLEFGEVEAALRRVPGVRVAVAAIFLTPGGVGALAAAVCRDGTRTTAAKLRDDMTEFVPKHIIPRQLLLVDRIPYTRGGKVDRQAVADQFAAAAADFDTGDHRACSTPLQSALAVIVGEVLGIDPETDTVHGDDDFFALGGDSVLATQAVARMRAWLDTPDLMVADIFAARTVVGLADLLIRRERGNRRLEQVAELYLEIAHMDADDVLSEVARSTTTQGHSIK